MLDRQQVLRPFVITGLAAARQLRAFGHQVIILEGNARAGGRVYTRRLEVMCLEFTLQTAFVDHGGHSGVQRPCRRLREHFAFQMMHMLMPHPQSAPLLVQWRQHCLLQQAIGS